jgi:serine phosphatase RsbU (regulator of sigma subunit)
MGIVTSINLPRRRVVILLLEIRTIVPDPTTEIRYPTPDLERDLRRERFAMRSLLEFARTLTPDLGPIGILKSIQRTIMGKALITDGFAYLSDNAGVGSRRYKLVSHAGLRSVSFPESITFEELETWLFAPPEGVRTTLPIFDSEQNDILAFLGFGKPMIGDTDLSNEGNYLESLSLLTGMAITNARLFEAERERERLEAELRLAREIQQSLLPANLPTIEGVSFSAFNKQSELVGGDYYDVIALSDHKALMVVADVVGKGASAAILMSNVQASLHALVPQLRNGQTTLVELASTLNTLIWESTTAERFVTAVLAVVNTKTNDVETVVCGHPRPILFHDDVKEEVPTGGLPLGVLPKAEYSSHCSAFALGTSIFLYTDGLSEAVRHTDGHMLGAGGVADVAARIIAVGVNQINDTTIAGWEYLVSDDLTLLVGTRN